MDVRNLSLPDDPELLKQLLLEQQKRFVEQQRSAQQTINEQQKRIDRIEKSNDASTAKVGVLQGKLVQHKTRIQILEEQLQLLRAHQFGKRSEKHPNLDQFQLFNEAEVVADESGDDTDPNAEDRDVDIHVPAHTRKRRRPQAIPADLPRVDVVHDLDDDEKCCGNCGEALAHIGEEITEQLCVVPQQHFAVRHRRQKYACSCKACIRTAAMPAQPIPGSQASARLLANVMERKYLQGLPLYRQEKIAEREGLELPRSKLARWLIDGSAVFIPLINLLEDSFFSFDVALSDDTGIRVLKEDGRSPSSQSALWIRRGGPPDKPVVLVDYEISKSGETVYRLLSEFRGYLVTDGADSFKLSVQRNNLSPVLCNDHARRRFRKALQVADNDKGSVARSAMDWYGKLYRIEAETKHLGADERYAIRQSQAIPLWDEFLAWATRVFSEGVAHGRTMDALAYLLKHQDGLRAYCQDGRLPISNIQSEHVAKTIAVMRKNFLFADTPSGAEASARIFSVIETARANRHNPYQYLSVLLTELPQAGCVEDIERLLPWNLTPEQVGVMFGHYPVP
jgi:transposase